MRSQLLNWLWILVCCSACGSNMQESGDPCEGVDAIAPNEVIVEAAEDMCGADQVCISVGENVESAPATTGTCSCRCDGPSEDKPFCQCLDGFVCTPLIEDLGLDHGSAGSYCVRRE